MRASIDSVDTTVFDRVWALTQEIGVQERHFNQLQSGYRNMASAWLLATFAGIGFVVSTPLHVTAAPELLVAGLASAGSIGISLLWIVDLLVYHRLLDSCFIEGLILEEQYAWLPPFRNNMMRTQQGHGVLFRIVGFYAAPIGFLILVAAGALSLLSYRLEHHLLSAALIVAGGLLAYLAARLIRTKTENTAAIARRLEEARAGTSSQT
jgi:hypothetical protein